MDSLKKYVVSGAVVVIIGIYAIWNARTSNQSPVPQSSPSRIPSTPTPPPGNTTRTPAGTYKDGTYTGSVADAFYGSMQVAATISGGKLTDVQFLQYPQDNRNSASINNRSNVILRQEAIAAQSANVDIVSGATQSSEGFQQSLASALAQAKS